MNLLGILTGWTGGQRFGISEQFARAGIELSGNTGWFALAPAAQILPRGDRPRHATRHLADATDELSRRPDHPAEPPSQSAGLTAELAGRPGESSRRPSQLSRRPGESDGRPSEPEGPGAARREGMAARRRPGAARRQGMDAPGSGMHGPRRPGVRALARAVFVPEGRRGAPPHHGWSIARAVLVPEGRRGVATGGAQGRRPKRNPWTGSHNTPSAPAGRRSSRIIADASFGARFLCPSGAGEILIDAFHGLRSLEDSLTPPVATPLDPSGVVDDGAARAIGARARAGDRLFSAGEVPEGRHAPLASAHLHAVGSGVRRG